MTVRAYKLGALGQDDLTGINSMVATCAAGTPNYMTFETPVGTDYQVPAGKTFYITSMSFRGNGSGDDSMVNIGYADGATADATSASNFVSMTGNYYTAAAQVTPQWNVVIPIPANKYPCVKCILTSTSITIYGIEV